MDAWSSQQLSPLYGREVFRSREADETHARVARELKPHRSVWGRGNVDAVFCRAELGALSLCILRYGCDVDIEPDALGNFVLVQMRCAAVPTSTPARRPCRSIRGRAPSFPRTGPCGCAGTPTASS